MCCADRARARAAVIGWLISWISADAIPLTITGGLEQGFRTVTYKENYRPGVWKVQVETADQRVVGKLRFSIVEDPTSDEVAQLNGWQLHTDGVHLNSRGGMIVADLVQEFIGELTQCIEIV